MTGPDILDQRHADALFEAGCDDATFGEQDGVYFGDFHRDAATFGDAVGSAIRQVEAAVPGLQVVRVERVETPVVA
jgi:hypothetical protein